MEIRELVLLNGSSVDSELVKLVCNRLGIKPGNCIVVQMPNKETVVDIGDSVRGRDVFILHTIEKSVNNSIMDLLILTYACKTSSARQIVGVIPYLPYCKQSKMRKRGCIVSKLLAQMLAKAGMTHAITIDLHQKEIQGFFDFPIDNLRASPFLIHYITTSIPDYKNAVIVAKNPAGARRAQSYAERCKLTLAVIHGEARNVDEDDIDGRQSPPPTPPFSFVTSKSSKNSPMKQSPFSPEKSNKKDEMNSKPIMNESIIIESSQSEQFDKISALRKNAGNDMAMKYTASETTNVHRGSTMNNTHLNPEISESQSPDKNYEDYINDIYFNDDEADQASKIVKSAVLDDNISSRENGSKSKRKSSLSGSKPYMLDSTTLKAKLSNVETITKLDNTNNDIIDHQPIIGNGLIANSNQEKFNSAVVLKNELSNLNSNSNSHNITVDKSASFYLDSPVQQSIIQDCENENNLLLKRNRSSLLTTVSSECSLARFEGSKSDIFGFFYPINTPKEKPLLNVVGDVNGKIAILVDDIIDEADSYIQAAEILKERGAKKVYLMATHGLFSGTSALSFQNACIDQIIVTNTVPQDAQKLDCDKIETIDISFLLSEAIRRIHYQESMSHLFRNISCQD